MKSAPSAPLGSTGQCTALATNPGLESIGAAFHCWRPLPCPDHKEKR